MLTVRSSWRYPFFWALVLGLSVGYGLQQAFIVGLIGKSKELYLLLTQGDLGLLADPRLLRELAVLVSSISLALVLGLFLLSRFIRAVSVWLGNSYTITPSKIIARHGLFARDYREGFLDDLRTVHIKQGFLDRLLGIGTMTLSTLGKEGLAICFHKISSPFALKKRLFAEQNFVPAPAPQTPPVARPNSLLWETKLHKEEETTSH